MNFQFVKPNSYTEQGLLSMEEDALELFCVAPKNAGQDEQNAQVD